MNVKLIDYQENALDLLLFTKNTRLAGGSMEDVVNMPMKEKLEHLAYMRDTIQSSWEFVKYTLQITGVTRNFTHQLVRTRTQSYAQESGRAVDQRRSGFHSPDIEDETLAEKYEDTMTGVKSMYGELIDKGMEIQDARNLLPSSIHTNIIIGTDLRTVHNTALARLCVRTQGEYQAVFKQMRDCIINVHPWASDFINVACVDSGCCIFPRYTECPVQPYTYNKFSLSDKSLLGDDKAFKKAINNKWIETKHQANPMANKGVTMK